MACFALHTTKIGQIGGVDGVGVGGGGVGDGVGDVGVGDGVGDDGDGVGVHCLCRLLAPSAVPRPGWRRGRRARSLLAAAELDSAAETAGAVTEQLATTMEDYVGLVGAPIKQVTAEVPGFLTIANNLS